MADKEKVGIVILNWNGLDDTLICLESLKKIHYPSYFVLVVDNHSDNDEGRILQDLCETENNIDVMVMDENYGYAAANNAAIRRLINQGFLFVLILNNDITVDPLFLDELMNVAIDRERAGILGPKTYYMSDKERIFSAGGKINMYLGLHRMIGGGKIDNEGKFDELREVDFLPGACLLIKKEVFDAIGLISEDFFLGWEDMDFCLQAREQQFKCIYVPTSRIWHKVGASFKRKQLHYVSTERGTRNRIMLCRRHTSNFGFLVFLISLTCFIIPLFSIHYVFVQRDVKKIYYLLSGYVKGIQNVI